MTDMTKLSCEELTIRHEVTGEQWELLNRALHEALAVKEQDVFLQAHIAALKYDLQKLLAEQSEIRLALRAHQVSTRLTA